MIQEIIKSGLPLDLVVSGSGCEAELVAFVGEAPGGDEDRQGGRVPPR